MISQNIMSCNIFLLFIDKIMLIFNLQQKIASAANIVIFKNFFMSLATFDCAKTSNDIRAKKSEDKKMVFSSLEFVFLFLPVFLIIYYIVPGRQKNLWLFMGSLGFYFYGVKDTPFYFFLLVLSILVNYQIGILIGRRRLRRFRRRWLVYGVIYNLFWLILFKYAGFFLQNLNLLLNIAKIPVKLPVIAPVLPVGISFYTFQAISYLADVYRKTVPYERSLVGFGMYISMFPQLIADPIVTYSSVRRQIGWRQITFQGIEDGLRDFTIGLGFKVLLANRIGGLWSEIQTIGYDSISTPLAWLGMAAFSLQIYFDFYGYPYGKRAGFYDGLSASG